MGKIIERVRQREAEAMGRRIAALRRDHQQLAKQAEAEFWQSYYRAMSLGTWTISERISAGIPWWAFWRRRT